MRSLGKRLRSRSILLPPEVWVIFSIALLFRVAFFFHLRSIGMPIHYDGELYIALAKGIHNGVFSMFHPLDIPETTRMPGYPFLIDLFNSTNALLLFQAIISAGKIPLFHPILRELRISDPRIGMIAMLLIAIEPIDIILSGSLLTESIFSFLLLLAAFLAMRTRTWRGIVLMTIVLASLAYLRPNGFFVAMIPPVLLILRPKFRRIKAFAGIVLLIALMLPWIIRDHAIDGRLHISDSGSVVASHFHVPDVLAKTDPQEAREFKRGLRELAETTDWTDRESFRNYFQVISERTRTVFMEHPVEWILVQIEKAARIMIAPGRGHISMFFGGSPIVYHALLVLSIFFSIVIALICLIAVIQIPDLRWEQWLLIAIVFFLIFSAAISTADARFKNPALPLILLLGASLLEHWRAIDRDDAPASRSS